jgi:hypothetical protein
MNITERQAKKEVLRGLVYGQASYLALPAAASDTSWVTENSRFWSHQNQFQFSTSAQKSITKTKPISVFPDECSSCRWSDENRAPSELAA